MFETGLAGWGWFWYGVKRLPPPRDITEAELAGLLEEITAATRELRASVEAGDQPLEGSPELARRTRQAYSNLDPAETGPVTRTLGGSGPQTGDQRRQLLEFLEGMEATLTQLLGQVSR